MDEYKQRVRAGAAFLAGYVPATLMVLLLSYVVESSTDPLAAVFSPKTWQHELQWHLFGGIAAIFIGCWGGTSILYRRLVVANIPAVLGRGASCAQYVSLSVLAAGLGFSAILRWTSPWAVAFLLTSTFIIGVSVVAASGLKKPSPRIRNRHGFLALQAEADYLKSLYTIFLQLMAIGITAIFVGVGYVGLTGSGGSRFRGMDIVQV